MIVRKLMHSVLALVCLTMILVPAPVQAQGGGVGLSLRVSPTTTAPGTTVGIISYVTNTTGKKLRTTVTFTSLSPCGIETSIGYHRLALNPGQTMMVTATYPIGADACLGTYAINMTATSGATTAAYLVVQ
jgi:uncharacterized membrane protein